MRNFIDIVGRLDEAVNAPDLELYHWTNAEYLQQIIRSDVVKGSTTHKINGKAVRGVSLSRNPFFDIQDTYQVAGTKAWRLGFNYQRLRADHRVIPMRDDQYRDIPRGKRRQEKLFYGMSFTPVGIHMASSDESEEFVVGDIYPVWHYLTSIAVEDRHVDLSMHPNEMEDEDESTEMARQTVTKADQHMLYDLVAGTIFGRSPAYKAWSTTGKHRSSAIRLPSHVRFLTVDRSTHRVHDFRDFYKHGFDLPDERFEDNQEDAAMRVDDRGQRSRVFNQKMRKKEP